jgi:hypothetical protein
MTASEPRPRSPRSPLPSGGDIVFLALLFLLLARLPNFVFADASTGWHLVTGQYIIDHLRVPHRDLISYTYPNKPWVAYEWLFDIAAALLVRAGGLPLLSVVIVSAIALLFALLYRDARRSGCRFLCGLAVTLLGALASSVHWLARPEIFTFFGVYIFARGLEALHRGQMRAWGAAAALGATMLVWTNAHPAFILGFGMIVIYIVAEGGATLILPSGEERRTAAVRAGQFAGIGLTAAAVSLINPNGASLYPYILALLRQTSVRNGFAEWMSPVFHGEPYGVSLELLFAVIVIGLAASRRRLWLGQLLLLLAFAHFALSAVRNVPLFVIVAVPLVAALLADLDAGALLGAAQTGSTGWAARAAGRWRRLAETFDGVERRCTMHIAPIAAVLVLAASCVTAAQWRGSPALVSSGFDPAQVPTATLAYVGRAGLRWNRGFALDNWGGYIRYETGHRVFIDDRPDFYGTAFYERYIQTIAARPGWNTLLEEYGIEWVLVPRDVPLIVVLEQTPGWRLTAEDRAAYLFVRQVRR